MKNEIRYINQVSFYLSKWLDEIRDSELDDKDKRGLENVILDNLNNNHKKQVKLKRKLMIERINQEKEE